MKVLPRRRAAVLVNSVLGVTLLGAAALTYATVSGDGSAAAAKAPTRTATVAKGTVLATVSGSGALSSPGDAGEDFATGGKVTAVKVAVGDAVTKGEVLATVDATAAQQQVDAAQAGLTAAQANLDKAEAGTTSVVRASDTGAGSVIPAGWSSPMPSATPSPSDGTSQRSAEPHPTVTVTVTQAPRDTAPSAQPSPSTTTTVDPAQVAQAEQQVQTAETNLTNAKAALAGTVLVAETDGTVAAISGKVGDTVSGSAGGTSGGKSTGASTSSASSSLSGFIVLTNPAGMQVTANFSELDSLKLKKGQTATVTLNAQSDTKFNASVVSVSSLPVSGGTANSAVQYAATLKLVGDTSKLRTGLSATVSVVTGEADNALSVPTAALAGTGSSRTATLVHPDGSTERVDVTVGIEGDSTVQVVDGLAEGDKVELVSTTAGTGNGFPGGAFPGLGGQGGLGGGGARSGGGGNGGGGFSGGGRG